LQNTLRRLLSPKSPVKELDFTILDNSSTDGSSRLIQQYAKKYPNIKHIRHRRNIGGNANIARAFEIADKKYVWVLCDDDQYDFTNFGELNFEINQDADAIIVADHCQPQKGKSFLFKQMSFVPGVIYKTSFITDTALINANFNVSNMFPQLAIAANVFNNEGKIVILKKGIVKIGLKFGAESYNREMREKDTYPNPLKTAMFWELGYLNSILMLKDKKLRTIMMKNLQPQNKSFYQVVLGVLSQHSLRYCLDFIMGLNLKWKICFLFYTLSMSIGHFESGQRGVYFLLFNRLAIKIIPRFFE
jgi:glycosyltransferase involved in cell wall biosynthesis